jgi:drug/metabolite transporter (DMT)-like permease
MDRARPWAAFVAVSLIWGSSFLFIKVALEDLGPLTLVGMRLLFGVLILAPFAVAHRKKIPRDGRTRLDIALNAVIGTALPFFLISWGEKTVDTGLTSVLNGTVPFFSVLIADLWLRDSPVTLAKMAGLVGGYGGILVLMGESLGAGANHSTLPGQVAVVAAALCYGASSAFVRRRLGHVMPPVLAFGQLLVACVATWCIALPVERPPLFYVEGLTLLFSGRSLFAVIWLGLLGSGIAYLLYYYLVQSMGSTRSSMVTHAILVVGVLLGVTVLGEPVSWRLLAGGGLIASGIVLVNWPRSRRVARIPV